MKKGILADSFFAHIINFFVCHVKAFVHLPQNVHENFGSKRKIYYKYKSHPYIKKPRLL